MLDDLINKKFEGLKKTFMNPLTKLKNHNRTKCKFWSAAFFVVKSCMEKVFSDLIVNKENLSKDIKNKMSLK